MYAPRMKYVVRDPKTSELQAWYTVVNDQITTFWEPGPSYLYRANDKPALLIEAILNAHRAKGRVVTTEEYGAA